MNANSPSEEQPATTLGTSTSNTTSNGGGLVDILNQLDSFKRNEMLALVGQYKSRSFGLNDFMLRARELLGERLYGQLARDMSNAASTRNSVTANNISAIPNMPMNSIPNMPNMMMQLPPNMRPQSVGSMPIHSMPQIYGQGAAPPIMSQSSQFPPQQQMMQQNEVDVTKMDTSSLQDVMQYSGVDLKAEAELLYRENTDINPISGSLYVDHRLKFDYFFNPFKFRAIVQHALQRQFFSSTLNNNESTNQTGAKVNKPLGISEEAVHLLGIAIQKRLIGIIRKLSEISRHRVDYGRGRFKIKIENDPKKQLWLQEKLFIEGVGEDKRRPGTTTATGATATTSPTVNQTLLNPPSLSSITSKATASQGGSKPTPSTSTAASSSTPAAGADDSVKTKLANVTALAALGIRQKSWMSSAASMGPSATTSGGATAGQSSSQPTTSGNEEKEPEIYQHPLANFYSLPSSTPLTDSELKAQYFNRTISTVDLISCMESDPHLRRSRLLAVLYESLPRENKENYLQPSEQQQ